MKSFMKKLLVLLCAMTLMLAPRPAFAAQSTAVLTLKNDTTTLYTFQPSPFELSNQATLSLSDGSQYWTVPAGKSFGFCCYYEAGKVLNFKVMRFIPTSTSGIVINTNDGSGLFTCTIPASDQDAIYMVYAYNDSNQTAKVINYYALIK